MLLDIPLRALLKLDITTLAMHKLDITTLALLKSAMAFGGTTSGKPLDKML